MVGSFFICPLYYRQHPRKIKGAVDAYAGDFCYVTILFQAMYLKIQIPNPYKIAFNFFIVLVKISSSIPLQSNGRRWSSVSVVEAEWRRLSTMRIRSVR